MQRLVVDDDRDEDWGATFSACQEYRYLLWRVWDKEAVRKPLMFLMLNPSTADENINDPTVTRCYNRAKLLGMSGVYVGNIFGYRSTDPKKLLKVKDPIGALNDQFILETAHKSCAIVLAWGNWGKVMDRGDVVVANLRNAGLYDKLYCLGITKDRQPLHPLYLGYEKKLMPYAEQIDKASSSNI